MKVEVKIDLTYMSLEDFGLPMLKDGKLSILKPEWSEKLSDPDAVLVVEGWARAPARIRKALTDLLSSL